MYEGDKLLNPMLPDDMVTALGIQKHAYQVE